MLSPLALHYARTPLHRLPEPSRRLGLDVWIKRDDLTGAGLSGNKVRKLAYLLGDALSQRADTVLTCGGIQEAMAAEGRLGERVVFWHTGGIFGLFGRGAELAEALAGDDATGQGA